jgi:hypothetical protein
MTIAINWQENGDLTISCGDDELVVPKRQLEKKVLASEMDGITFLPISITTDVQLFPKLTGGKPKVVYGGVRMPSRKGHVSVENITGIKEAIARAVGSLEQPEYLCLGWNSKEAIPIGEVNAMIEAEPSIKFEIDLYPDYVKPKIA